MSQSCTSTTTPREIPDTKRIFLGIIYFETLQWWNTGFWTKSGLVWKYDVEFCVGQHVHIWGLQHIHILGAVRYSYFFTATFPCINIPIGIVGRVFAKGPGDQSSIPGRVIPKTQKMVLDSSLRNTQHYKVRIIVKRNNPGNGVM